MLIAAHQPNYLPNLAFFYKMSRAQRFVLVTNLQFEKQEGWQQRHKIQGVGADMWLTVPVLGSQHQLLKEVKVNNAVDWRRKHLNTLRITYAKSPERELLQKFLAIYQRSWERLADLNITVIQFLVDVLGIRTPLAVDEEVSGEKHHLLINICKKYGADTYLSGTGAQLYMTPAYLDELVRSRIQHCVVDKNLTPLYPYSTVHYLFTQGRTAVRNMLDLPS